MERLRKTSVMILGPRNPYNYLCIPFQPNPLIHLNPPISLQITILPNPYITNLVVIS